MTEPIGYLSSSSVQGFASICFMPSAMRLAFGSMSRTTASTSSPTFDELRGVLHALRPGHLGDVDEALDALLELDERAVVGERDDLALDARADRVLLVGAVPRVLLDLLEAQADALGGGVELEDDDADLVADLEHLATGGRCGPSDMSVMWSRPSMPPRSMKAP